ncbi:hypothetical protein LTR24_003189 [Lithohypha guttulata]|uniref:L-ornithine N(5)-oxygenase n=1 Tax=Lithohypha guttulata TaxID=1690604 RepID=A0ABR0KFN7_9EURO|nr:hypothetical protein LTR24_003189 [Lithohypha guttulata]
MVYDIAIIGAGPCGLAVAARLSEKTPSALFTNDEHARYWKRHRQQANSLEQERNKRKTSTDSGYGSENEKRQRASFRPSMVVLDANSNEWMATWKKRFRDLKISHLRSPLFFHPDPSDRDGLLAFAHEQDRVNELREIPNVVGKELSKHEKKRQQRRKQARTTARHLRVDGRDQIDYYTPSTALFDCYCDSIIRRYRLDDLVQQVTITDISYDPHGQGTDQGLFTLSTSTEATLYSRIVIVASGTSSPPSIPNFNQLPLPLQQTGSITHVFAPTGTNLPPHIHQKLTTTHSSNPINILIIGGGLTSAQLISLFLSHHPRIHIHLLLRHPKLKCKPFDIDLPWVSKTRNHVMSTFWSAPSDSDRISMLRTSRTGGSVNALFAHLLKTYAEQRRLTIHTSTHLVLDETCTWDPTLNLWTHLNIQPPPSVPSTATAPFPTIAHIVYCTGATPSLNAIPFLSTLRASHPITTLAGLPKLSEELSWSDEVPCFFTGALAALRLGPGAANLAGARSGAERVAWAVEELLGVGDGDRNETGVGPDPNTRRRRPTGRNENEEDMDVDVACARSEFTGSFSNQFAALDVGDAGDG